MLKINKFNDMTEFDNLKIRLYKKNIEYSNFNIKSINSLSSDNNLEKLDDNYIKIDYDFYNFTITKTNLTEAIIQKAGLLFENCGKYTILLFKNQIESKLDMILLTDIQSNGISILWQSIQIVILTFGEILFSISGYAFVYSQAPPTMKSMVKTMWLISNGLGNLIVIIISKAKFVDNQVYEYLIFAGLLIITTFLFAILSYFYKYEEYKTEEFECENSQKPLLTSNKIGISNHMKHEDRINTITRLNVLADEVQNK